MKLEQFHRRKRYVNLETDKRHRDLAEVLDSKAFVDPGHRVQQKDKGRPETLFHNVRVVPPGQTLDRTQKRLCGLKANTVKRSRKEHLSALSKELLRWCGECFRQADQDGKKLHLVFHSSGWDSRLMSWAIKTLGREKDCLFVCYGDEIDQFCKIMESLGIPSEYTVAVSWQQRYVDKLADAEFAMEYLACPMPGLFTLNCALGLEVWDLYKLDAAYDRHNDVVQWSGFGSDFFCTGAGHRHGNRLGPFFRKMYALSLSRSKFMPNVVAYPFLGYGLLEIMATSTVRLGYEYREPLVRHIDPKLARIEKAVHHIPPISKDALSAAVKWYEASWYGRNVRPEAVKKATRRADTFETWWADWSSAVYCERLIRNGVEVTKR